MKSLSALSPRLSVLDGTADFVVNLADLASLSEEEAREFLDANVLTSGMELLLSQAFARLAGTGSSAGVYKLSESMGGGKTQTMIVAGILARFPQLADSMRFQMPLPAAKPDVVASFTGRSTDKKVWVALGEALGTIFAGDRAPSETEWRDALKDRSVLILLDELYAILRRRLFKTLDVSSSDIAAVADAYVAELKKASAIIERPTMKVREEILVSYPFHFSTKHLIASFNENPGFQKTTFPKWYADSMRQSAVKGNDASFRVAMAECYRNLAAHMPDDGLQVLMFTHKSTDVWEDLALIMWSAGLQVKQVWSVATETAGVGIRAGNYVQATYNMVLRKRTGAKGGFVDFITPQINKRVTEVITRMRESQVATGLARCGYTDTDYLLAAQAAAAEVVTGYSSIDGVDLEAELRTPNKERGRSALRNLMDNAKRTATDFLVPPAMDRAIAKAGGGNPYQFWRQFSPEEKFLLKGLEGEAEGVSKLGAFQDLGRAYGLADYEKLLGPVRANATRTALPEELPRPDSLRFDEVPAADRGLWRYSATRHLYHALKLLQGAADPERAVKHLVEAPISGIFVPHGLRRLSLICRRSGRPMPTGLITKTCWRNWRSGSSITGANEMKRLP